MKIGIVSTFPPKKCGIAEFSANLLNEMRHFRNESLEIDPVNHNFLKFDGRDINILSRYNVVHFQNQGSFWSGEWFQGILKALQERGVKTVVTFHDSAIWNGFNGWPHIDLGIAHRPEIIERMPLSSAKVLPMPVISRPVELMSFGLGRNDNDQCAEVCDSLGYEYRTLKPQDKWLEQEDLIKLIRTFDGVILWYKEVGIVGGSAGARLAITARRPVFLSNVSWFSDIKDDGKHVIKFNDASDLRIKLANYYKNEYINEANLTKVASDHIVIYRELLNK